MKLNNKRKKDDINHRFIDLKRKAYITRFNVSEILYYTTVLFMTFMDFVVVYNSLNGIMSPLTTFILAMGAAVLLDWNATVMAKMWNEYSTTKDEAKKKKAKRNFFIGLGILLVTFIILFIFRFITRSELAGAAGAFGANETSVNRANIFGIWLAIMPILTSLFILIFNHVREDSSHWQMEHLYEQGVAQLETNQSDLEEIDTLLEMQELIEQVLEDQFELSINDLDLMENWAKLYTRDVLIVKLNKLIPSTLLIDEKRELARNKSEKPHG